MGAQRPGSKQGTCESVREKGNATAELQALLRDAGFSPLPPDTGAAGSRRMSDLPAPVRDALVQIMNFRPAAAAAPAANMVACRFIER